jgi:RimJ/RimL family protein N-acetyltransferase
LLHGKRVTLRGLELEDASKILRLFNDLDARRFLLSTVPYSQEEETQWIRGTREQRRAGTGYVFGIEVNTSSQLIGVCSLDKVSAINRSAKLGIAIFGERHWDQGLGTEALHLLLDYGFGVLNLHRICLSCFEDNLRAQHVYTKVGFMKVGCLRQAIYRNGEYYDLQVMDLLAEEHIPHTSRAVGTRTTISEEPR